MLSSRALSQTDEGPSVCVIEEVNFEETEVVYSEEAPSYVDAEVSQDKGVSSLM